MLSDLANIQQDATLWHLGHTFLCPPATACPTDALGFDDRRVYKDGSVSPRRRSGNDPRICPPFFSLDTDGRARAAYAIVALSFGDSYIQRKQNVWGYASLALAIYHRDFGAPPAASLAEHQAADRP
jgi:hypothetical protein